MLIWKKAKATCGICGDDIQYGDGMMVEWEVDDPTAEECGQRFICGECSADISGECWLRGLLRKHPEAKVIRL